MTLKKLSKVFNGVFMKFNSVYKACQTQIAGWQQRVKSPAERKAADEFSNGKVCLKSAWQHGLQNGTGE